MINLLWVRLIIATIGALLVFHVATFNGLSIFDGFEPKRFTITTSLESPSEAETPASKNAFVIFLAASGNYHSGENTENEDHYFIGTRMLIYQLLHDPATRTNSSIPVVVLVTSDVSHPHRKQLNMDGAQVIEVERIKFDWIKPRRERWTHVMDKLHVFQLTQFDKVLLLDADIVVTKRLDAIFDDPAAQESSNLQVPDRVYSDEAPQPSTYIMAGNSERYLKDRLNAGFVILKPSKEMFGHYLSVGKNPGKFPGTYPEQDLWYYVHNLEGNMPWKQIESHWALNLPTWSDYTDGIATLHEKYWKPNIDSNLKEVLLRSRWKMEGFFDAYHAKK